MAEGILKKYRPSWLRFTHDSIKAEFNDGTTLEDTLSDILDGDISVSDLPPMEVMKYQGRNYVVRGNRRLYLYKKLEEYGHLTWVKVLKIPFDGVLFARMHSTDNGGTSVWIRGPMGDDVDSDLDEILSEY